MSAYVVHTEHIRTLIWAGIHFTTGTDLRWAVTDPDNAANPETVERSFSFRRLNKDTAPIVGQMLLDENTRSVNHRYDEGELYVYNHAEPASTRWNPVEILSALACYEYQACEHPGWVTSEAYAFCQALRTALVHALPGYAEGPWEIGPDSLPLNVQAHRKARA